MSNSNIEIKKFSDFNLSENLLKALDSVGYEVPTPIQSEIIPHVLEGKDVLGQAQTGTGKTAAFALPLLSKIQISKNHPQVLVLTPTRELAIQVSEAFQKYASFIQNFHVMPVYGGQGYDLQLKQLRRGVHVVVGTPGRVMDHIKRKTLKLDNLKTIVLDEADEMLRMGFIDDVNWIMEQTPEDRQVALFSATMPAEIKNIAKKYQKDPIEISIKVKTSSAETIRQRYWFVKDVNKLDALTRILESENIDGVIIFVRTKTESSELSDRLRARGFLCDAINGDLPQKQRERTVENLKSKKLDILIATDVAARGLDVERISHVINYDIPYDTESYIHRIGRTGRAGRSGEAILFVSPREKKMLHIIQKATGKTIDEMMLPSHEDVNDLKLSRLSVKVMEKIEKEDLTQFNNIIENIKIYNNTTEKDIASAIALMLYEKDSKLFPHIFGKKKKEDN
ncbi:MAG: DEAD/DEAH box helicase, partial [Leptospiraceae bacterium]|nr:DEAD/DEAH box helicase [Leptospiraceae bacterium]